MYSNKYTFLYAIAISVITAILLSLAAEGLRPYQEANFKLDIKTSILRSVLNYSTERDSIEKTYNENVEELVINSAGEVITDIEAPLVVLKKELEKPVEKRNLPLYIYTTDEKNKLYVIPMQGKGLWGPIFGYISIEDDFNTVHGAYFTHKSETPGLGAEISEQPFQDQFKGKKIMGKNNKFVSVHVLKSSAKSPFGQEHRVDGISGGTITSNGTDQMLKDCIEPYLAYFKKLKKES